MKYFFCLLILASLFGCQKKEDPCLNQQFNPSPYSPLVFSFIDADSTNLLENNSIDTTQILIKDDKGAIQKLDIFLDSTHTKARFVAVPILEKQGTNELKITTKGKETSLKYDFTVITKPCWTSNQYDNYVLNAKPYQLHYKKTYYMHGKEKIPAFFRVIYITE
jgi:hypothetical protein